jgi:hypothetical protein
MKRILTALVLLGACDGTTADHPPTVVPQAYAQSDGMAAAGQDPTIEVLASVVSSGRCVKIERMPGILARLSEPEFRLKLGSIVAGGNRDPNQALTEWLHHADAYQELCDLHGSEETEARTYVKDSVPLSEEAIDRAIAAGHCGFLVSVHEAEAWPYEVRMGREVLSREFEDAEVTRRLWISVLEDFEKGCGAQLSRRGKIKIAAQRERLDRIVGLDDPTLIDLRSNMLSALESGDESKVVAYAQAIAEREKALDSRQAAQFEAKLAAIQENVEAQQLGEVNSNALVEGTANVAGASQNVANTAENVANTARAAATTVNILRSLF